MTNFLQASEIDFCALHFHNVMLDQSENSRLLMTKKKIQQEVMYHVSSRSLGMST
jgi:hypothetical protein